MSVKLSFDFPVSSKCELNAWLFDDKGNQLATSSASATSVTTLTGDDFEEDSYEASATITSVTQGLARSLLASAIPASNDYTLKFDGTTTVTSASGYYPIINISLKVSNVTVGT
jgi:hypothetical protein